MAGERTFVVKILGNSDSAITAFKNLAREGKDAIDKIQSVGSGIGKAFDVVQKGAFIAVGAFTAVAGAALGAVIAAAQDEKSQKLLADQLLKSADATLAQVSATEQFIEQAMLATGIADDELRPAFGNLVRATNDLEESQSLFTLALDISAATGRDLETVTLGLGRAATGQIGALTRLGIPLDEGAKKSKDFGAILETLQTQFGGAAATAADTFSGRVKILKTSLGEVVEEIGFALLPAAERLVGFLQEKLLPALQAAAKGFKEEGLAGALKYFLAALGPFGVKVIDTIEAVSLSIITLGGHLDKVAAIIGASLSLAAPTKAVGIFNSIINSSENAAARTSAKFDALRNSIVNTGNALNFANNKLSPLVDQTDKIGTKVLPKAKEASDEFAGSLEKVKTSSGGASKTVETSKQKLEKYTDALKSSTSAQKALTSAQRGTADATKNLADSKQDVMKAQKALNDAVNGFGKDSVQAKEAQRGLDRAQRSVAQAGFRVEGAVFAVADAEKALAKVRTDPESSPQAIREAEINLEEAKLAVRDATDSQFDATTTLETAQLKLNEAVGGAIVGSVVYNALLKDVEDAKEKEMDASERLTDAVDRETEAYDRLKEAIKKVGEAAKNSGRQGLTIPTMDAIQPPPSGGGSGGGGGQVMTPLPTVPQPAPVGGGFQGRPEQGAPIIINTGIGTNGVEAGRQIVEVLQQYSRLGVNVGDLLAIA